MLITEWPVCTDKTLALLSRESRSFSGFKIKKGWKVVTTPSLFWHKNKSVQQSSYRHTFAALWSL